MNIGCQQFSEYNLQTLSILCLCTGYFLSLKYPIIHSLSKTYIKCILTYFRKAFLKEITSTHLYPVLLFPGHTGTLYLQAFEAKQCHTTSSSQPNASGSGIHHLLIEIFIKTPGIH